MAILPSNASERTPLRLRQSMQHMSRFLQDTIDDFLPNVCDDAVAQAEAVGWGVDEASTYCARCGATVGPDEATERGCSRCLRRRPAWRQMIRLGAYKSPMSDWIVAMKFKRQWTWGPFFGHCLADLDAVRALRKDDAPTAVCPVPMHWLRRWSRGYNQAHLIARAFARRLDLPLADVLHRPRRTLPQTDIAVTDRARNLKNAIKSKPVDLTGWTIWLIDDVTTTGATLNACAAALRRAGVKRIFVAVAAVADPKGADFTIA